MTDTISFLPVAFTISTVIPFAIPCDSTSLITGATFNTSSTTTTIPATFMIEFAKSGRIGKANANEDDEDEGNKLVTSHACQVDRFRTRRMPLE
ncbi:hypothetical protein MUK42_34969 [Musa troglodytarum]|uniref:Uncharacterized protein n=1 Tax=Musa troglodytarum TaxID=320322 RepID=A0A9E7HGI9_9LILI|nr:hypothetical protein MUK42_34969 [Musa troglodytarum]